MDDLELYWNNSWQVAEQYRHATLMRELKAELGQLRRQEYRAAEDVAPAVSEEVPPTKRVRSAVPTRRQGPT